MEFSYSGLDELVQQLDHLDKDVEGTQLLTSLCLFYFSAFYFRQHPYLEKKKAD